MPPPARTSSAKPSGGMSSKDKKKVIIASVMLGIAGLLLAWTFGLFDSVVSSQPQLPPAQKAELEKAVKEQKEAFEKLEREGKAPVQAGS